MMNDAHHNKIARDYALHQAHKIAQDAPEVRDDRVAAAKRSLRHGTLMLDADTLATQMLTDPHHGIDLNS
ncbi:MAG TPA: flagellar biosynthesis anti-sigma factor FlgM [Candidatus Entotheonella sp.]|jgi:anti-sigma28 factor (negative regulator of flagellin synthesis)